MAFCRAVEADATRPLVARADRPAAIPAFPDFAILQAAMGLYSRHIFPRIMDLVMSGQAFQRLRTDLLQDARGEVLEIGFGTGLNLAHYPASVSHLSAVDPADLLPHRVRERIATVSFPVRTTQITAEVLPYPNRQFDRVVSTWTLCTIPDPVQALREIARVLKPEGTLLFLEHGRSDDRTIAAWQDRLNPIQNVVGCGCHLNRPIDRLIAQAGLRIAHLDRFLLPDVPRIAGEMYRGRATPFPLDYSL